ncbi:MAG: DUF1028 domain-containing protein [Candidatus Bathyarchaeia archaeon]
MTFSIVARCPKTLALGVCVSTAVPAVGSVVPHVEAEVGAVATQGQTSVLYGINGLKLLKMGFSPQTALDAMLKEDLKREKRQVAIIAKDGRTAAFTGKETLEWRGHLVGEGYVVAGNALVGAQVIEAMAQTFENSKDDLAERLLKALEAGQEAGGDRRGKASAALFVVDKKPLPTRPFVDLRVDEHPNPVAELRRVWEDFKMLFLSI